jgi:hypothetical protein
MKAKTTSKTKTTAKTKTSLKRKMNRTAILSFYNARFFSGDIDRLSEKTGYSKSHISNVIAGRRSVSITLADAMYYISYRRAKNSEVLSKN